jgi:hypothetical protein
MADKIPHTHADLKQESARKLVKDKSSPSPLAYTPEQLKHADETIGIVQLISGTTAKGEAFYAYVKVKPSLYEEFVGKLLNGDKMDVDKYGKVLKKGFGAQPPDDVKKYMEESFGVDHNYMQRVTEEVEKLQKAKK